MRGWLIEREPMGCLICEERRVPPGNRRAREALGWRRQRASYRGNHQFEREDWYHGWICPQCIAANGGEWAGLMPRLA